MHPKKELGQHWLHDTSILQQIAGYAQLNKKSVVLEVGPGLGTLTAALLEAGARVTAVEFDQELASQLPNRLAHHANLTVINQDILKFNLTTLPAGYKMVANIPYYLTSKLIRIVSESINPPDMAVILVQKEVAERVCAQPGAMSLLSVSAQVYFEASLGVIVPAALFTPPPKVDSQVLILKRRPIPLIQTEELDWFFAVVKAGFSERRKKLRSSLSGGLRLEKSAIDTLLQAAHISPDARAQELSIEQWQDVTRALKQGFKVN